MVKTGAKPDTKSGAKANPKRDFPQDVKSGCENGK
jgi:hypothetical protein